MQGGFRMTLLKKQQMEKSTAHFLYNHADLLKGEITIYQRFA